MASSTSTTTGIPGSGIQNSTTEEVGDSVDSWMTTTTPRIVFLSTFICLGFCFNLFLIITVCHSRRFRSVTFYVFVINLAVVNMCECTLNMTILLSSSILNQWTFGDIACRLSAFFFNVICIETTLGLTILTTDRMISVRYKEQYEHVLSTPRLAILIGYTWFQAISFGVPIAAGAVSASVNTYINNCAISKGSSGIYSIFTALFCFVVPFIIMIVFFIKIIRTGYKERLLVRTLISQHNYTDDAQQEPQIKTEIRYSNLTGTICGTWLLLEGPYVVTSYFTQFQNSPELESIANKDLQYAWYVDLILLWLRFSYALVLPIATFSWNKELWKSLKDMILCRKNNAIIDESFKKNETDKQRLDRKIKEEEKIKEKESMGQIREQRVFQVPVLFATSNGVHIQTHDQSDVSENEENENIGRNGTLRGKKCDVIGSLDNLNTLEDDTSDYDSGNENDPFSMSHPISVKQSNSNNNLSAQHRSISQPDVRDKMRNADKTFNTTVGTTSGGDSGVDLSTLSYKNLDKSTFKTSNLQRQIIKTNSNDSGTVQDNAIKHVAKDNYNQNTGIGGDQCFEAPQTDQRNESHAEIIHTSNENSVYNGTAPITNISIPETPIQTLLNTSAIMDSPAQKRKKKKRKDKSIEGLNSVTSSPMLPLRPPPRLAPIGIKSLYSSPGRPDSACSSKYSITDSNLESVHSQGLGFICDHCQDLTSSDNISVSSFSMRRNLNCSQCIQNSFGANDNHIVGLEKRTITPNRECARDINSVPEEVLTARGSNFETDQPRDSHEHTESQSGIVNAGYEQYSDEESTEVTQATAKCRNSEARKKRREKLASNLLCNEVKGYQRLVPDTP